MWTTAKSATEAKIGCVPHQTGVIFAGYCHHSAVVWNLLTADPFDADVGYFFKITKGLPLSKHTKQIQQKMQFVKLNVFINGTQLIGISPQLLHNFHWFESQIPR